MTFLDFLMNNIFCKNNSEIVNLGFFHYFPMKKYEILNENSEKSKVKYLKNYAFLNKMVLKKSLRMLHFH